MSVFKRPGSETYSYDFRYRRKRFSGTTGCTTKREAEKYEERERQRVASLTFAAGAPMTVEAAFARYWNEIGQFHRNDVDTLRSLGWLEEQLGRRTMISTIDDDKIAFLVARRRGEAVSNATVNRSVCEPLRAILRRARKLWKQDVQEIEWKAHFLKEPQERIREASAEEEAKLMAAIRGDYAPALRFALLSGCRRAEIVGLRWTDVDFFTGNLTVRGKGDRKRIIPITGAIYDLLKDEHGNDPVHVFTYIAKRPREARGQRRPITMEGFKTEWRRTRARAGIEDYRFHDNRHTAATRLVRATGNLRHAQRLLGHTDIATTSRYAHVTNDDLRAGMEASTTTKTATQPASEVDNDLKKKEDQR